MIRDRLDTTYNRQNSYAYNRKRRLLEYIYHEGGNKVCQEDEVEFEVR